MKPPKPADLVFPFPWMIKRYQAGTFYQRSPAAGAATRAPGPAARDRGEIRMRVFITIGLLASLLLAPLASAQIAVFDAANHVVNSVTAVQSTISAVEAVIHTAKWIIEQTPLDEFVQAGDLAADLAEINALVREAQALGYDVAQLQRNPMMAGSSLGWSSLARWSWMRWPAAKRRALGINGTR